MRAYKRENDGRTREHKMQSPVPTVFLLLLLAMMASSSSAQCCDCGCCDCCCDCCGTMMVVNATSRRKRSEEVVLKRLDNGVQKKEQRGFRFGDDPTPYLMGWPVVPGQRPAEVRDTPEGQWYKRMEAQVRAQTARRAQQEWERKRQQKAQTQRAEAEEGSGEKRDRGREGTE